MSKLYLLLGFILVSCFANSQQKLIHCSSEKKMDSLIRAWRERVLKPFRLDDFNAIPWNYAFREEGDSILKERRFRWILVNAQDGEITEIWAPNKEAVDLSEIRLEFHRNQAERSYWVNIASNIPEELRLLLLSIHCEIDMPGFMMESD